MNGAFEQGMNRAFRDRRWGRSKVKPHEELPGGIGPIQGFHNQECGTAPCAERFSLKRLRRLTSNVWSGGVRGGTLPLAAPFSDWRSAGAMEPVAVAPISMIEWFPSVTDMRCMTWK